MKKTVILLLLFATSIAGFAQQAEDKAKMERERQAIQKLRIGDLFQADEIQRDIGAHRIRLQALRPGNGQGADDTAAFGAR